MFANNKMRENSGRLIKIYRERMHQGSKDKRFSCNEFILATKDHPFYEIVEGEPVCSRATLNRLERGQIIKDDELYVFFIEKLGFKVDDFPGVMSQVDLISDELFEAVELYDINKIKTIDNEIDELFLSAKEYFYYKETFNALKIITSYYIDAIYPDNIVADEMINIGFILNAKVDELVTNILFDYFYCQVMNIVKAEYCYKKLIMFNNNSKISSLFIAGWLMHKERWFAALNEVEEGLKYFEHIDVKYHLGVLYFTKAMALHTGNKENVQLFFDKSIECLEKVNGKLANGKLIHNYFNIGFQYYFDKKYDVAAKYFNKFLDNNPPFTVHLLYILNCAELLWDEELLRKLKQIRCIEKNSSINKVFYNYFLMKLKKTSAKELENYIIHDIYDILQKQFRSDNLINYFKNELTNVIKITKHYKLATYFDNFTSYKID